MCQQALQTTRMQTSESPPACEERYGTRTVVSTVAYLLGVPKSIFDNMYEPPDPAIYEQLEKSRSARIIRNLCSLRTAIERNFGKIFERMVYQYRGLYTMSEYVPLACIDQLAEDGVPLIKTNHKLTDYLIDINRLISDRINNCKELFPLWLNWQYVRELFIMPDGLSETGLRAAADIYYKCKPWYPYQMYLNWKPRDEGNILFNDKKFAVLLYQWHGDEFQDFSKVSDAGAATKSGIYDFLDGSEKTVIVVDCENSDPYKLCATLRNLDAGSFDKISKIVLYNDVHAATAWSMLDSYTSLHVEHELIARVKQDKSLVDIRLTAGACREFYQNHVDSFIIASSDSDYWGLISSIPEARFLVMVEHDKCGPDIKAALEGRDIFYCYLDDFYTGNSDDIKFIALLREVNRCLGEALHLNVHDMMREVFHATRVVMSDAEKAQFYNKYIKPMHLVIDDTGNVRIELQKK